jgi:hypothetical protein
MSYVLLVVIVFTGDKLFSQENMRVEKDKCEALAVHAKAQSMAKAKLLLGANPPVGQRKALSVRHVCLKLENK